MKNNRKLVIGDIHGGFKALVQIINRAQISKNDELLFLGDYVDGWSQSLEVIDYLITLKQTHNCIFIKGNHDDLFLDFLKTNTFRNEWLINGGKATIDSYKDTSRSTINQHIEFLESLLPYHIDNENRLFVHGGFTNQKGVMHEFFKPMFYWDRTLWETAIALNPKLSIDDKEYPERLRLYKEIFIGHTPVLRINKEIPQQAANVWNIDTGAAFEGKLSIMDINTKQFWQSDDLPILYPSERGRN